MPTSLFLYDPFSELDRVFNEAFDARFRPSTDKSDTTVDRYGTPQIRPRMDLHENKDANTVTATFELPGLTKEGVQINLHNGRLHISGENKISTEHEKSGYAIRERRYGKFSRTLQLPQGLKEDQIKATVEDGILTVTFPRTTPEMEPKKITIA